ncbi:MAG TPA: rhodanese-like domain-containing protein [Egibacteraceae bacterium]|nr:rhodanese-like domain-containing protein [Egibacteraceae bacterium]
MAVGRVAQWPSPEPAHQFFRARLACETDPADVRADLSAADGGEPAFVLIDARPRDAFADAHLPGAISLPHAEILPEAVEWLPKDRPVVTYCWSISCNAGVKAAAALSALGYRVKEMIGGIEAWRAEGYPIESGGTNAAQRSAAGPQSGAADVECAC